VKRRGWLAAWRLVATYAILTALLYGAGEPYSRAWCQVLEWQIERIQGEFSAATVTLTDVDAQAAFRFEGTVTAALISRFPGIPPGAKVWATTLQAYAHNHAILIFSILVAWPAATARHRARLLLAGVPATGLSTSLDIPYALAALTRGEVYAAFDSGLIDTDLLVRYFEFLQGGGRLMLPVAAAGLAIAICKRKQDQNELATSKRN
jgi:hypothetical protein